MEKTIESRSVFEGKMLKLRVEKVELENGNTSTREIISHNGGCAVVVRKGDSIVFVSQFRKAIGKSILEIPAGKLESEEDPLVCAKRELKEETGYVASEIIYLGTIFTSPGYSDEVIHIYYADNPLPGDTDLDSDEFVEVQEIKIDDVFEMIKNGDIKDGKTLAGLMMAKDHLMGYHSE